MTERKKDKPLNLYLFKRGKSTWKPLGDPPIIRRKPISDSEKEANQDRISSMRRNMKY